MEQEYLNLLKDVLENGEERIDRTGVGTKSLFGKQMRFDLTKGFPAVTTKKLLFDYVTSENLFFLTGSSDERMLARILHGEEYANKKTIWTANAQADYWKPKAKFDGDLGRVYGVQWRNWLKYTKDEISSTAFGHAVFKVEGVDQIKNIINTIKTNPTDRRMVLSAFNVGELDQMALPPCHMFAQFYVSKVPRQRRVDKALNEMIVKSGRPFFEPSEDIMSEAEFDKAMDDMGIPAQKLSCQVYLRSNDLFLGAPFNIAGYAMLTHMIAQVTGLDVGELIITIGDAHIYLNHVEQVKEQLSRAPFNPPTLWINPEIDDIDNFAMEDFKLQGYEHHPAIKGAMAV